MALSPRRWRTSSPGASVGSTVRRIEVVLAGRDSECRMVDDALAAARSEGRSTVLVVRGEPGIGKSALLDYAVQRAAGLCVLRATGVESEAELPYAGLHALLRPVLNLRANLPVPHARAL